MSNPFKSTASALAMVLALAHVVPIAADLLVCIDDRTDRGCCEELSAQDAPTGDVAARLLDGADCGCCVIVRITANTADATVQKVAADYALESEFAGRHVAPVTRHIASTGRDEPDNPRLPSLRTVVLLI